MKKFLSEKENQNIYIMFIIIIILLFFMILASIDLLFYRSELNNKNKYNTKEFNQCMIENKNYNKCKKYIK